MSVCFGDYTVKARKNHVCTLCGETIPKREVYIIREGVEDGDGHWRMKMHVECEKATAGWDTDEWEGIQEHDEPRPSTPENKITVTERQFEVLQHGDHMTQNSIVVRGGIATVSELEQLVDIGLMWKHDYNAEYSGYKVTREGKRATT